MFEATPPPPRAPAPAPAPDAGKALSKALEAERKKVEAAAEKKALAEALAEAARQALADKAQHNAGVGFGQRAVTVVTQRGWSAVGLDDAPADASAPATGATRPAAPRGFFSHVA